MTSPGFKSVYGVSIPDKETKPIPIEENFQKQKPNSITEISMLREINNTLKDIKNELYQIRQIIH